MLAKQSKHKRPCNIMGHLFFFLLSGSGIVRLLGSTKIITGQISSFLRRESWRFFVKEVDEN